MDTSTGNLIPVIVSDRVGALRTAEWRKPRKPTAGATVAEPEIRRFCQQADVENPAGCETAGRTTSSTREARAPHGRVRQNNQSTQENITMIKDTRIKLNVMKHTKQVVLDNPITPANAVVTATITALGNSITTIEALDAGWDQGKGTFLGAAEERRFAKAQLQKALSALSLVSKSLDKALYPDIAAQLKVRNHRSTYQGVLAFGRAAIAVIEPIKQVFIDHGSAATVVDDLEAHISALETAGSRKLTGQASRTGKTAALRAEARIGMDLVRKLDAILSQLYKNNVELYTAWKAAMRQEQNYPNQVAPAPAPVAPPAGS